MNIAHSVPSTVSSVSFSFLTPDDIRRISVKQIKNPGVLEYGRPVFDGLYDPALGPSDRSDICATCRLTYFTCPGHYGHIELPSTVFHPLFLGNMYNLLRGVCMFCHRFKITRIQLCKYMAKLRLIERGLLAEAQGLDDMTMRRRRCKVSSNARNGDSDEDGGKHEGNEKSVPDETPQEFMTRIHLYVAVHLSRNTSKTRDSYKDGISFQAKKDLINDFLKATILKKCQNPDCGCPAYTFRKEGHTKIVEYDLSVKDKNRLTRRRPNVMQLDNLTVNTRVLNEDIDMGDSEDGEEADLEGEDVMSDAADEKNQTSNLPKAANGKIKSKRGRNERVITPAECRAHLRRLFYNETAMCALVFGRHGPFSPLSPDGGFSYASPDMFFMDVILVPPTRFRPPAKLGDTLFEHPQNELLGNIIRTSYQLRELNNKLRDASEKNENYDEAVRQKAASVLLGTLIQLQVDVNSFMDSNKNPKVVRQGKLPPAGVKQGLEKKEGLFRKHMMGKRVNYAARSVISPDVNIDPNEIGIPPVFARKLTFPEPVTPANFHELRQLVITGPHGYPGASIVEYENGDQQSLEKLTVEQRTAIANQLLTPRDGDRPTTGKHGLFTRTTSVNKKVYRHLRDGDILILNRQPTLHKPSMMTHQARVLHGEKTIRMHYANCNSYNADFDGDEMNIHFPQNHVARAEAIIIANTDNQYLVPTSGNPIRGLIQDHVVAGVWMTCQNTFFDREEYFQLLYGALRPENDTNSASRLVIIPPAIWKPKPLWTGKQIISTILKNITPRYLEGLYMEGKTKVPGKLWGNDSKEDKVVIIDGELLCGVLDKASFGASDYGLVHSVYELYGADTAGKLLGILSRLLTNFLQHRAFTCRMDDLILTPKGDEARSSLLEKGKNLGYEAAVENFPSLATTQRAEVPSALRTLLEDVLRDDKKMAGLDMTVKTKLSKLTTSISDACLPNQLHRQFPYNHMQTMTLSGAKGSAVNVRQISCGLGQQELEGRRVPVMVSGKTLPSFRPFETRAIAGGYVASRFLTGVKPQEFYFHCMAGREGLIDTAVKTSRSGYLQRCLIKHLEGIRVHYDNTVRGSDNSVYQFAYGGDALDVTKQKHLYQFDFVAQNHLSFARRLQPYRVNEAVDQESAVSHMKRVLKSVAKSAKRKKSSESQKHVSLEPALSLYNPTRYMGSTSEEFATALNAYIKSDSHHLARSSATSSTSRFKKRREPVSYRDFRDLMNHKYMRSLVEPGEAVGLLASQGVGEPSTQMTLNTFHFAGHGAANVTLGIPRLREIVMTASQKPKTPSMTMTVQQGVSPESIDSFCKRANRVTLSQVVENVLVQESLWAEGEARRIRFIVDINFYPREEYQEEHGLEPSDVLSAFQYRFPASLKKEIAVELKKLDADMKSQIAQLGIGKKVTSKDAGGEGEDEDEEPVKARGDDEESVGDGDAEDEKRARQKQQQATYESDSEDEEDEDIAEYDDEAIEAEYSDAGLAPDSADATRKKSEKDLLKSLLNDVSDSFQRQLHQCTSFNFDASKCSFTLEFSSDLPKLLFVGIVERVCKATVIREISGILECFQVKDDTKGEEAKIKLTTNGSNLNGMWDFAESTEAGILEIDGIYSNDIYAMLQTYGVEMARATILREMKGIFAVYNIDVNRRHLELIADYMTFDGGYKPFNRKGLSTNPSPLLKASFETTGAFLSDATLYGDFDDLTTPSGNIVLGRPNATGTGVFDVVIPIQ